MKIVIIGGNAAGMSAAGKARRSGSKAEIIVFEKSGDVSWAPCGLPYYISGDVENEKDLTAVPLQEFRNKRNIDVRLFHEALSFDPHKRTVLLKDHAADEHIQIKYDRLIIASGARPVVPDIPGINNENMFALHSLQDGRNMKTFLEKNSPRTAVVAGAGFAGLEICEALVKQHISVQLVEIRDQVLPYLDKDTAQIIADELQKQGVKIFLNSSLQAAENHSGVTEAVLGDGRRFPADMIVYALGIQPNTAFARSGGVRLGKSGAIAVNNKMQTNIRHVYAAGDCAETRCRAVNKTAWVPLGTAAVKQGRTAGDNAAGKSSVFKGGTSTRVIKVFDIEAASTGINTAYAVKISLPVKSVLVKAGTKADYYPGAEPAAVKLLFTAAEGTLLGAQTAGGKGSAKRIDVLAAAVQQKMTVFEIAELDLGYAPPFAPVWDPVLIAAHQAVKLVRNN